MIQMTKFADKYHLARVRMCFKGQKILQYMSKEIAAKKHMENTSQKVCKARCNSW